MAKALNLAKSRVKKSVTNNLTGYLRVLLAPFVMSCCVFTSMEIVSPFPRPLVGGVSGILSRSISLMLSSSLPPNKACECCRHAIFINVTTLKSRFTFQGDFIPSSFLFFFYLVRLLTEMHLLETLSIFGRRPIRLDLTLVLCFTSAV